MQKTTHNNQTNTKNIKHDNDKDNRKHTIQQTKASTQIT